MVLKNAAAGRFINIYPKGKDILLPRPISISEINEDGLTLVFGLVGRGTQELAAAQAGDSIRISTPLGNGFDIQRMGFSDEEKHVKQIVLFGGGIGTPPLVELAKQLRLEGCRKIAAVTGFKKDSFLTAELLAAGARVYAALETQGQNVLDKFRQEGLAADYAFACGPLPMLRALAGYFENRTALQVSIEERMGCGYGACAGCVCHTKSGLRRVCCDGPVFMADEVKWNEQ